MKTFGVITKNYCNGNIWKQRTVVMATFDDVTNNDCNEVLCCHKERLKWQRLVLLQRPDAKEMFGVI